MEGYIFSDVGAWKSIEELEESLTLGELMLIVSACRRSDYKRIKMTAMAAGAEVTLDDDDYGWETDGPGGTGPGGKQAASGFELTHLPVGLGYVEEEEVKEEVAEATKMGVAELIESRIAESEAQYIKTEDEDD
jgi:hypothetical protein|tara:strand:- start:2031 stop:2432 length:402 start_codon:yes stop_codon:yes gene_type:complete